VARSVGCVTGFGQSRTIQQLRFCGVFAFFSNRLGCFGSIAVSVIGTILLLVLMRGCSGGVGF
jgi:hypothetical protein